MDVLSVDNVKSTVPAYELWEVTVTVDTPLLPCAAVMLVAARVNVPVEEPVELPTVTGTVPEEAA
jgi:hypothetical protein